MAAATLAGEDGLNLGIPDAGMAGTASCRIAIESDFERGEEAHGFSELRSLFRGVIWHYCANGGQGGSTE
jgi:hypothetical protein